MNSSDSVKPTTSEILQKFREDPRRQEAIRQANAETIKRMKQSSPVLVGVGKAGDNVPGMRENLILHAGPPITWNNASPPVQGCGHRRHAVRGSGADQR